MIRPSKGAAAFLIVFGLIVFVPGLLFLVTTFGIKGSAPSGPVAGASIALLFMLIGSGLVFAAFYGYRRLKQQEAMEEANPSSPWLWRPDWASRQADSQNKNRAIGAWIACVLGNLFVLPFAAVMLPELARRQDARALIVGAFCCLSPVVFVYAVRATLRQRRFGKTFFEFYSLPFTPGSTLSGRIHFQLDSSAEHGIDLRLSCVRKTVTGSGKSRSTVQTILWQADQHVSYGALGLDSSGRTIPVEMAIPPEAYVTDKDNPSDQVLWLLHAQADLPGIDYSDDFEVPVFRTASSSQSASVPSAAGNFGFGESSANEVESTPVPAPANPQVIISSRAGGTEFSFRAFRNPGRVFFLLLFISVWTGAVYLLLHTHAPWFFPLVFGGTDLILILALFHIAFGSARIRVGNGQIVSTKRTLGIGRTKVFPFSEIETVLPVTSGQQSSGRNLNQMYGIRLRTKDGQRITLADEVSSRQEARWIVSQIETLAGLKLDTRVQVDAPFGATSQPPQPYQPVFAGSSSAQQGAAFPAASTTGRWQSHRQSSAGVAISFAVFGLVIIGMFAWQIFRTPMFRSSASSARGVRSSARKGNQPVVRRVFATPMTDADVNRVLDLPAQDQAEELLERAVQHDEHALELFDQQVEFWVGHIRLTPRMKQLESRSQYSTDLRVRYASGDIQLTLDGWRKNEEAVDLLIQRARTDQSYRAAAVYFLGMLAGREIAYAKIHPVLLEYARHDSDPTVRQWAVEGMRYLGKDEALDELWESFTHDPSLKVRERAGCNLSDCGNFTRRQRMRMVPKFLELLADSKTDAQMRTWSAMALHEITDQNLPADAHAWQDWYGKHGAEKLAEFESLDWWKVHGDE